MFKRLIEALKPRYVYRDAETGRFVSPLYAMMNKKTTVRERIR